MSSPHLPPSPIQPSSTEMDGPTMTCRHPAHTAHGIQLFYPPDQQLCASVPWTPTPAAPGNPNTCATPVSPSAPSPHPPENRLTPRTLRNHSPFRTMHKQAVSWDHHPTTPPLYSPFVPFASGITDTACRSYNAQPGEPGTTNTTPTVRGSTKPYTSGTVAPPYVASGNETAAATTSTTTCTSVQVVERSPMELAGALKRRKHHPQTPYRADTWECALEKSDLSTIFPSLVHGLHCGFVIGYPVITCTQFPPNSTSIPVYQKEFEEIINKEISKNRYIGPLSITTIESLLGPYQSSLSMIPKPRWPGKFRLIQNFSFPITPSARFPTLPSTMRLTPASSRAHGANFQPFTYSSPVSHRVPKQ